MADKLKIRDFIYIDVERMKSIFSQIYQGFSETSTEESGSQKSISAMVEGSGGIPLFAQMAGEIEGEVIWENRETETKTLHDHMYNLIEDNLKENDRIYIIQESYENIKNAWVKGELSKIIPDNSFILIKGRVMIDDYKRFEQIATNFNTLNSFLGDSENMTEDLMEGILTMIKLFYQNELFIKILPYPDNPYLRFIGNLNRESLRDSIESITFKYGTYPVSEWYFFGQVSSIFPKDYNPQKSLKETKYGKIFQNAADINRLLSHLATLGFKINSNHDLDQIDVSAVENISKENIEFLKSFHLNKFDFSVLENVGMDMVFESIFNAFREIDYAFSTKFPSVTFTPIAVYREV